MDNKTIVLSSARAIRQVQLEAEGESLFLPNFITMSEFISKLCVVDGYRQIDEDSRILLLLEASNFQDFSKLQIERSFFTFTKNSSYIFSFFQELSAELYAIENLYDADIYAEYEEHIKILYELYKRYETLCNEKKLLDTIFLPKLYRFNTAYAKTHQDVYLHLDGFLTNFELELLQKATQYMNITLTFEATRFNLKMQERFTEIGFALESGYSYTLLLNTKEILKREKRVRKSNIHCESFSEAFLQVAFIKKKVYEYLQKGYSAQKIAVVLPDEKMAETLRLFDSKGNFNFAMGESYSRSKIYKLLDATLQAIEQNSKENEARLERVGKECYLSLVRYYYKSMQEVDFVEAMEAISALIENKTEYKIFQQELYRFEKILPYMQNMQFKSALKLFMQRLSKKSIDDVRGGKITVLGVLETRSVNFDGVIIVDFNEENVPKKSDKDMFLNTKLRKHAGLPTMLDRENLQKHYYEMLMFRSKEVAISYVESAQSKGSKFLKQLGISKENLYDEQHYAQILFHPSVKKHAEQEQIVIPYSFKNISLSATRLKSYLSCKRKYYYAYIARIKEHEIPRDIPKEYEIGLDVHSALKNLYTKQKSYTSVEKLQKDLYRELEEQKGTTELEHYLMEIQKRNLEAFCVNEVERFSQGWEVFRCEEPYKEPFMGITISGHIDRIDKRGSEVAVLDYKTGSYTLYNKNNFMDAKDFQLEFYTLLAAGEGVVVQSAFYDLKEAKIIDELFLDEKIEILKTHIAELLRVEELDCEKTQELKECLYCPYKIMCGRG